ncbi:MAG: ComF family protein [Rickettsiales bacterium]|nr:ComF family protein [Rickettsiales bacterium]
MSILVRNIREKTKPVVDFGLNAFFPPLCPACQQPTDTVQQFCISCFNELSFVSEPLCDCCGKPFDAPIDEKSHCMECIEARPTYLQARTVLHYDEVSRPLITRMKYADQTHRIPAFATMMQRAASDMLPHCDVIIPVPLHWRRMLWRTYNQSAQLGAALSKRTQIPMLSGALTRTRNTPAQASLPREERLKNVMDAFAINARHASHLHGKSVLLIDDVITTGATIDACTQALYDGGVGAVYVLSLARTFKRD